MRKAVLYIAMSLDGYIADRNGGVGWLSGHGTEENPGSYDAFAESVDTVIMGWNTYEQIVAELSPESWVYEGMQSYVVTHRKQAGKDGILFTDESPVSLIERLKQEDAKDIWLCGGASLAQQAIAAGLIDMYRISVIPSILGGGIRLFGETEQERLLHLKDVQIYDGITELIYEKRE